jgi:hypothetical protein
MTLLIITTTENTWHVTWRPLQERCARIQKTWILGFALLMGYPNLGVYRKAGETYEEAYLLSGRAVPELKKKSDRCKFLYHFWGRDKPDPDKIDINELKRLAPSIISTNVPP